MHELEPIVTSISKHESNASSCVKTQETSTSRLVMSGRIDSTNAKNLMSSVKALISSGEKSIVVDLGAVLYLTSNAFRALLVATDEAERNAAKLVLCNIEGQVRELFEMSGLLDAFTVQPSRVEAVATLA
jgi:stage II sporulation protein AA (anti-sigma F factor antagonist)